jgi:quercetin dioxygenase-like cupin family protein
MENSEERVSPSKVVELSSLINYHKDATVSRTIIDKDAGTVTLFAFDKGQGLSEHTAPFDALVYLLEGEAEVVISGKSLRLVEGEIVVIPANHPHTLGASHRFKMLLTMIRE